MEENFELLVTRVLNSLDKSDLEQINSLLKSLKDPTICVGVGGSHVVSTFMSKVLNSKNGIITTNGTSRDMRYMNKTGYQNVVCCSYAGRNIGVDVAFSNDLNKYLFSSLMRDGVTNIIYDCDREHSFISLAATLVPMTILLNYYLDGKQDVIKDILNNGKGFVVEPNSVYEVMSGHESLTAATYLESTLAESGIAIPIVHNKYDFCHGRSTTGYRKNHSLIYFNGDTELDELLLSLLGEHYKKLYVLDYQYDDAIVNDYYLTYNSMLLSRDIARSVDKDLSKVDYSPVVKKLYKYRGEM